MKHEDEFYIGWQEQAPSTFKGARKRFFAAALIGMILFGAVYLLIERPFIASTFDFGNLTELEGNIVTYPVFGLKTTINDVPVTVPLVGFGKFDALPVLEKIRSDIGKAPLENVTVKLRGTLIQYKDRTWMELTEGDASIVELTVAEKSFQRMITDQGQRTVFGEIVDPKCFFGVMNPAYGKIHRSCAIRCISGGIPPLLATRKKNGQFDDYYFLVDRNGQPVNKAVLSYIGTPVSLSGKVQQLEDWKVITIDPGQLTSSVQLKLDQNFAYCLR